MGNIFTEFRRVELMLRHLTMIAELANEGIVVVDPNGIIRFVNKAWAKMHGYDTRNELVGKHINMFHTEEQMKTTVIPFIEEVKRRGQLWGPVEHVRHDGTLLPTETKMTLVKDEEGKAVGLIVFVIDMTEQWQNAEHLKQQTTELVAANEKLQREINEHERGEEELLEDIIEAKDQTKGIVQFNPQELKALAELAKRLR